MDSANTTTTFNHKLIVKGASCVDGFLTILLDNVVTRNNRKKERKYVSESTGKTY